ncbi:MAG: Stp1/IreP family PP2C-type Ser/Thr phosphatase [bacterium]|nr:Stp1/IreP family PP2C-type Ser/Thr phosphatase [bacterium]
MSSANRKSYLIQSAGKTDPGRVRARNEDNFSREEDLGLFLVADGMGGHAGGETASELSVTTVRELAREFFLSQAGVPPEEKPYLDWLAVTIRKAGEKIYDLGNQNLELRGMGTTTTALWIPPAFDPPRAFLAHVGDSRAYRLRESRLEQLTRDHSWVMEQVRAGHLTVTEAKTHRFRSLITRSVGFQQNVEVDSATLELKAGDIFMICSDGLSNMVGDPEIQHVLETTAPEQAAEELIIQANAHGGIDNITVLVIKILPV